MLHRGVAVDSPISRVHESRPHTNRRDDVGESKRADVVCQAGAVFEWGLLYYLWFEPKKGKVKKVGGEMFFLGQGAGVAED